MKQILLATTLFLALLFTGCLNKSPQIDATTQDNEVSVSADSDIERIAIKEEVVPGERIGEGLTVADKMAALEAKLSVIYFDFDKYDIRADQVSKVDHAADLLKSEDAVKFTIKIEGNTDEWGTDEYNYALGLKRAKAVKDALVDRGVDANKMVLVSYGESNPVCTESNKECWQKNRRVEFKVLP